MITAGGAQDDGARDSMAACSRCAESTLGTSPVAVKAPGTVGPGEAVEPCGGATVAGVSAGAACGACAVAGGDGTFLSETTTAASFLEAGTAGGLGAAGGLAMVCHGLGTITRTFPAAA